MGDNELETTLAANEAKMAARERELDELEIDITESLDAAIGDLADDPDFRLKEIQPPTSVVRLAARAAAQVLMAFERGHRMG